LPISYGRKLTGQEEQVIAAIPTDNLEAYDAYLRGAGLYIEKLFSWPGQPPWAHRNISEKRWRFGPESSRLSWALLSYVDARGYLTTKSSTNARAARRGLAGGRNRAHSPAQSRRGPSGQGILLLRLPEGLRHRSALLRGRRVRFSRITAGIPEVARLCRGGGEASGTEASRISTKAERLDPRNASLLTTHAGNIQNASAFPRSAAKV